MKSFFQILALAKRLHENEVESSHLSRNQSSLEVELVRYKKLYKAKQEEDGVRREQTENILRLAKFKQSNRKSR